MREISFTPGRIEILVPMRETWQVYYQKHSQTHFAFDQLDLFRADNMGCDMAYDTYAMLNPAQELARS